MAAIVMFLIYPLSWMWKAFVLTKLWAWFLVPAGVPALGVATAMGLTLIVTILVPARTEDKELSTKAAAQAVAMALMFPLVALGFGWALRLFTA